MHDTAERCIPDLVLDICMAQYNTLYIHDAYEYEGSVVVVVVVVLVLDHRVGPGQYQSAGGGDIICLSWAL